MLNRLSGMRLLQHTGHLTRSPLLQLQQRLLGEKGLRNPLNKSLVMRHS